MKFAGTSGYPNRSCRDTGSQWFGTTAKTVPMVVFAVPASVRVARRELSSAGGRSDHPVFADRDFVHVFLVDEQCHVLLRPPEFRRPERGAQ